MVRHGETAWNAEGRVQGQTDVPLNELGHVQARAVAAVLAGERFDAVYSSDLLRVRQTAEPTAGRLGLPVAFDSRLRERHYGMFERHTYAEVRERYPAEYARFRDKDPEFDFGSGEALGAFERRALDCVAALIERHPGQSLLVFTHGGVLEMVYRRATARGLSSPRDFEIPNAGLNRVEAGPGAWRVTAWADVAHLERALDDLPG
jgi:probable phosphoglycerate mutase